MNDAQKMLDNLLRNAAATSPAFPPNSRYNNVATAVFTALNGDEILYLKRRFVPSADSFATLTQHVVRQGERPDHIANAHLGDPELYWRLCDGNGVMQPQELVEQVNTRLRITLPAGVPGDQDA